MLGGLHEGRLTMSEARRFPNLTVKGKDSLHWDIPQLYQETLDGLRGVGAYEETVDSVSCNSWASDYLLFESDGSLITPTFHHHDPRAEAGMKNVCSKVSRETVYEETGVQQRLISTLNQLGAEKSRRLDHTQLMPVADGFNYLLGGVPRIEMSLASPTQLYNPVAKCWSDRLLNALRLPSNLFPPVVPAGTVLGALRPEIAEQTGLGEARVVASCSHKIAAALAGLPINPGEHWAYLRTGSWAVMGTELAEPIITDTGRELNFTNEMGYGGSVRFSKRAVGYWILEECQRFWMEKDRALDSDVLTHLAGSSQPFESLVNLADPRFLAPDDMPLKIQAFCKETNQTVPRKPGPIVRCVLESLALLYRKTLREIESLTGREIKRLYILGGPTNTLLNHFIVNALHIPAVIAPAEAASIGNVVVQALALGHIKSLDEAREIVRNSFKMETIVPHAVAWDAAYVRLSKLCSS
jgi:rhamnulokinase